MVLGPQVGERTQACIRHRPNHRLDAGFVRTLRDGEHIGGHEVVVLNPAGDGTYDVTSMGQAGEMAAEGSGPAQVATDEYRDGWDRIFGKGPIGEA